MTEAMAKLAETAVEDLARCLYEASPISREFEGVWKKVRFGELNSSYIQALYNQAEAAINFMGKFQSTLESVAARAVNERLDELIAAQSGAGQNAEKQTQI